MKTYMYKGLIVTTNKDLFEAAGFTKNDYSRLSQASYNRSEYLVEGVDYITLMGKDLMSFVNSNSYIYGKRIVRLKLWTIRGVYRLARATSPEYGYKILDVVLDSFPPINKIIKEDD